MASRSEQQRNRQETSTVKEIMHKTKLIQFFGRTTPIVLQNDNGPCPLLAICNILLLRNNLRLSSDVAEVSQEKLLSLVTERLLDSNSNVKNKDERYVKNQEQNISDAIDLLPHLATGIDVNIKFTGIGGFEFTSECAIFDLFDIPLYHGWIVDPKDADAANAIGSKSYNTLIGELVVLERQRELIRNFLKNSASQLTGYGLFCLQKGLKERQLCVFFRNNHFNTLFKFEGELYILATDQGYLNQPDLVWEKLNEVNGDTEFMNSNFKKFQAESHETRSWDAQNAMDYLARIDNTAQWDTSFSSDMELALALQQEEYE